MTRTTFSAAILVLLLGIAACSDDPSSANTTPNGSIGAKVDGGSWSATSVQATRANNVLAMGGAEISGSNNRQININALVQTTGTYQINPFAGIQATYTEGSGSSVKIFTASSGQVVVSTLTATGATGTFTFTAAESQGGSGTRSVTEGTFDVKF